MDHESTTDQTRTGTDESDDFPLWTHCGLCGDELTNDLDLDTGICSACAEVESE